MCKRYIVKVRDKKEVFLSAQASGQEANLRGIHFIDAHKIPEKLASAIKGKRDGKEYSVRKIPEKSCMLYARFAYKLSFEHLGNVGGIIYKDISNTETQDIKKQKRHKGRLSFVMKIRFIHQALYLSAYKKNGTSMFEHVLICVSTNAQGFSIRCVLKNIPD
ncbi:MAG: hypothetical protein KAI96_06205 [Thermodesulfovibrionia bacterium]|nr:hypothetical protein [Thermodesulfovibrionia bacterium]MCK5512381.1 hypothetical protein [Thermodesulfovibrionia bacterium]